MAKGTQRRSLKDFPDYKAAVDKIAELRADRDRVKGELDQAWTKIHNRRRMAGRLEIEAKALVGAGGAPELEELGRLPTDQEIRNMEHQLRVIDRAIPMAEHEMRQARSEASQELARELKPEYEAIVKEMVAAAEAFGRACDREDEFCRPLIAEDVAFTGVIRRVRFKQGLLRVYGTPLNQWLNEVEEHYGHKVGNRQAKPLGLYGRR